MADSLNPYQDFAACHPKLREAVSEVVAYWEPDEVPMTVGLRASSHVWEPMREHTFGPGMHSLERRPRASRSDANGHEGSVSMRIARPVRVLTFAPFKADMLAFAPVCSRTEK
ncbi:hypothetical protein [Sorangium sp. So ce363]|uniref:hypothetical protein n=1 Tax=Sorangium sp. So ce363 TaxID=3133304 RepID=UPI003F5DC9BD